jgi:hypothetical protein
MLARFGKQRFKVLVQDGGRRAPFAPFVSCPGVIWVVSCPGLDPDIHAETLRAPTGRMDWRINSGNDGRKSKRE